MTGRAFGKITQARGNWRVRMTNEAKSARSAICERVKRHLLHALAGGLALSTTAASGQTTHPVIDPVPPPWVKPPLPVIDPVPPPFMREPPRPMKPVNPAPLNAPAPPPQEQKNPTGETSR